MSVSPTARLPLLVDATTTLAEAGRIAHGTTRVERGVLGGLLALGPPGLAFCRFDRSRHRFLEVPRGEVEDALARAPQHEHGREVPVAPLFTPLARYGRRLEAGVRTHLREPFRRAKAALAARLDPPRLPDASTLLFAGEMRFAPAYATRLARLSRSKIVSTIYDVLPMPFVSKANLTAAERRMLDDFDTIFRMSDLAFCISGATMGDVVRYAEMRRTRCPPCVVMPLANVLTTEPATEAPAPELQRGGFVLGVGDLVPRKNQALLVRVWKTLIQLRGESSVPRLVLAGRVSLECAPLSHEINSDPGLRERVLILANAGDAALAWLYANCRFTVFPSLNEGYGLPVAESLALGKLCVASSAGAIPEAAQGQAILLSPTDDQAWLATLSRLIDDDAEIARSEERIAREFQPTIWTDTAGFIVETLENRGLLPA